MSFDKITKTVGQKFTEYSNTMIKNGNSFSVECYDIAITENDETIYMDSVGINEYIHQLFNQKFKFKQLPERALENMRKKGIEPKKQPIELLLIFITIDKNNIYFGVSIPHTMDISIDRLMEGLTYTQEEHSEGFQTTQLYGSILCEFPLKDRDVLKTNFFNKIKSFGLYQEEEEDDEMEFNLNDL